MFYTFVSSGCVGLLRYWIDTGMALPEESLAKCLEYMVTGSLQYLQASQS